MTLYLGSGCDSVGRAVLPIPEVPGQIQSSAKFIEHLFTVNCIEETKIKKKGGRDWPIFIKKIMLYFVSVSYFCAFKMRAK